MKTSEKSVSRNLIALFFTATFVKLLTRQPGKEKICTCGDPIEGSSREGRRHWSKASHENVDNAKDRKKEIDVVFFGDSITEGWKGTSYGFEEGRKKDNPAEYESLFTLDGGGKYEGLVLGISGDTVSNVLAIAL